MAVSYTDLRSTYEIVGTIAPSYLLGFHFVTEGALSLPTREIIQHIGVQLGGNSRVHYDKVKGTICAFDFDDKKAGKRKMMLIDTNADLHYYGEIGIGHIDGPARLHEIYRDACLTGEKIRFPVALAQGMDIEKEYQKTAYTLHDGVLEMYFTGGTADLPEKIRKSHPAIRKFARDLYGELYKTDKVKVSIKNRKTIFRTKESGKYDSGFLKIDVEALITPSSTPVGKGML